MANASQYLRFISATVMLILLKQAHAEHDFTIRGQFVCTSQGITMPVEGAIVGIMRDKAWAADPIEAEVRTAPDGTYTATVKAKDVDTYYAKLFMNDKQGVFLRDWWTLSVLEVNSANRAKNKTGLIDLGTTEISRDHGNGTPQCAIWQGGRVAWQEYMRATGQRPLIGEHGNYQIVMESTISGFVWTSRDTTHWEFNWVVGEYSNPSAPANPEKLSYADIFQLYGTNLHEFGHALRHTADGSDNHFNWDVTRFVYAHKHEHCRSYPTGYIWNNGYGFNEGWADYWQETSYSGILKGCISDGMDPKDFRQEGSVALDLEALEASLGTCAGISARLQGDDLIRQRRGLMFEVLSGAGHEKIHSDGDFRAAFQKHFPNCPMPSPGTYSVNLPARSQTLTLGTAKPLQASLRLIVLRGRLASLPAEIAAADQAAKQVSPALEPGQRALLITRPAYLRGQLALSSLLEQQLAKEQANPPTVEFLMSKPGEQQRAAQVKSFDQQANTIVLKTLTGERAALVAKDSVANAGDIALLDHEMAELRSGSNRASSVMLHAASGENDDVQTATQR